MANSESFSLGVDNVIQQVRPYGRLASTFPNGLDANDTRRSGGETLQQWFVRLVDTYCNGDPDRVAVEENVAIFASLKWRKDELCFASIPALVTSCDLVDFYFGEPAEVVYLRLDLNYEDTW